MTQNIIAGSYTLTNLPAYIRNALVDQVLMRGNSNTSLKAIDGVNFYNLFETVTGKHLTFTLLEVAKLNNLSLEFQAIKLSDSVDAFTLTNIKPKSIIESFEWERGFVLAFPLILDEEDKEFIENVVSYQLAIAQISDAIFVWENDWTLSVSSYPDNSPRSNPDSVVFDGLQEALANGSPVRSRSPNAGTRLVNPPVGWVFLGVSVIKF